MDARWPHFSVPTSHLVGAGRLPDVNHPPFERLLDEHGAVVMRVCRALLSIDDAEDAWSETFLSALQAYPDLKDSSNLRGWLVTIAHRKSLDQLRRRSGPGRELPPDRGWVDRYPSDGDGDLWRALAQLPPKQREAVALHHVAGFPYGDIASLTGTTPEAARRAASDGVASLRRHFPPEETP